MPIDEQALLHLLEENAQTPAATLAAMLQSTEPEVAAKIRDLEERRVILAYKAIIDDERAGADVVKAVIEVRITPERGGGFNRLAERISKFGEVSSCFLMSGGYDLLVFLEGRTLREVATFVSEKLATLEGVLSTATHFMLKTYKDQGVLIEPDRSDERLKVSP